MENILNQPVSIGQLSQYVLNPLGFWLVFALVAFLFRNKITNFTLNYRKNYTYFDSPDGKGVAWCYILNIPVIFGILKWSAYWVGDKTFDFLPLILISSIVVWAFSFISVWPCSFVLIVMSIVGLARTDMFTELAKKILS